MAKTILIVDDNASVRQMICEAFKRESDFEVCGEAENGKEAIAKALELYPDLIVLDLSMPVMNGLDAARELKRLMPTVPLIMYSLFEDVFGEQQARLIGFRTGFQITACGHFGQQSPQSALSKRRVITSFLRVRKPCSASSMTCLRSIPRNNRNRSRLRSQRI